MLSAFSVTADLSTCTRCGGMRSVTLDEFRRRVRGRPFRFLLRYHLRRHDRERVRNALDGSLAVLSSRGRSLALETAESWRRELAAGGLAEEDCAELVDRIAARAAGGRGSPAARRGDEGLFDVFEVATLTLVLDLLDDPGLRADVGGLRRGFVARHRWHLVAAAALACVATLVDGTLWRAAMWAGAGAAVLPPVARLVGRRA